MKKGFYFTGWDVNHESHSPGDWIFGEKSLNCSLLSKQRCPYLDKHNIVISPHLLIRTSPLGNKLVVPSEVQNVKDQQIVKGISVQSSCCKNSVTQNKTQPPNTGKIGSSEKLFIHTRRMTFKEDDGQIKRITSCNPTRVKHLITLTRGSLSEQPFAQQERTTSVFRETENPIRLYQTACSDYKLEIFQSIHQKQRCSTSCNKPQNSQKERLSADRLIFQPTSTSPLSDGEANVSDCNTVECVHIDLQSNGTEILCTENDLVSTPEMHSPDDFSLPSSDDCLSMCCTSEAEASEPVDHLQKLKGNSQTTNYYNLTKISLIKDQRESNDCLLLRPSTEKAKPQSQVSNGWPAFHPKPLRVPSYSNRNVKDAKNNKMCQPLRKPLDAEMQVTEGHIAVCHLLHVLKEGLGNTCVQKRGEQSKWNVPKIKKHQAKTLPSRRPITCHNVYNQVIAKLWLTKRTNTQRSL
ncbi:uncharacterized protein LOC120514944 [Polypterus senegalus]|uniref:uncharacterized protein LOC120514944 n=1 Tax=Polypterus senegalus TaxID=55291 RepID=UPI001964C8BF|nr:uncharacterized protein LOC120514944 [Polypterus senegalus]